MIERVTTFSSDRCYRYTLWREWSMNKCKVCGGSGQIRNDQSTQGWDDCQYCQDPESFVQFIGLNPSTADETLDDPTIRRCKAFAQSWGYGAMCMTNIFAWRDTDPNVMKKVSKPIGEDNEKWLAEIASHAGIVIAAWGKHGKHMYRANAVKLLIPGLHCLRKNKDGSPEHPLYLPGYLKPIPL